MLRYTAAGYARWKYRNTLKISLSICREPAFFASTQIHDSKICMYFVRVRSAYMLNGLKYIEHNQLWSICAMYIIVYNLLEMMWVLCIKIYLKIQFFATTNTHFFTQNCCDRLIHILVKNAKMCSKSYKDTNLGSTFDCFDKDWFFFNYWKIRFYVYAHRSWAWIMISKPALYNYTFEMVKYFFNVCVHTFCECYLL